MNGQWKWLAISITVALIAVLGATPSAYAQFPFQPAQPSPGQPAPQPSPAGDPRAAQIKAGLEKEGLKVFEVSFQLDKSSNNNPQWYAVTGANYPQPSGDRMLRQAFTVWGVMYDAVSKDDPKTLMSGGQAWSKYILWLHTRLSDLTTLVTQLRTAKTDAEKDRAFQAFLKSAIFRVWDYEKQQYVDQKDFINKNFTK